MGRRKSKIVDNTETIEKKPPETAISESQSILSQDDYNTKSIDKSSEKFCVGLEPDDAKGRHFWYVVYPTEAYVKAHFPNCPYDGHSGWGTAPDDWVEQLQATGLPFNVSPFHQWDFEASIKGGLPKKPHWHVIVSWGNTTTYRTARALCDMLNCAYPKLLRNVVGAYRYHNHKDDPDKHQYTELCVSYNGWLPPIDSNEIARIKRELLEIILTEDIQEYTELVSFCGALGDAYFEVASTNTYYCNKLCESYRHNPIRVLMRYYNGLQEGETKDRIREQIGYFTQQLETK